MAERGPSGTGHDTATLAVLGDVHFTLAQAKGYIRTVSEERKDGGGSIVRAIEECLSEVDALRARLRSERDA